MHFNCGEDGSWGFTALHMSPGSGLKYDIDVYMATLLGGEAGDLC